MRKAASHTGIAPALLVSSGSVVLALSASLLFFTNVVYAWSTSQSVNVICENSVVQLQATFKNTEPQNSGLGMKVVVTDQQSGNSVDMGTVAPGETKTSTIGTGKSSVANGSVKFNLTWSSGQSGVDSRSASYSAKNCVVATPVPTASPTQAPTASPTVAPTTAPTAVPTASPTLVPTPVSTVQPTVAPTSTPVVVSQTTPAPTNRTDLTDNRSDGRKESLDCVAESQNGRKSCNNAPVPVVAGVSTDQLPSTGSEGSIMGAISLVALFGGILAQYASQISEKKFVAEYEKNRKIVYAKLN